MIKSKRYSELHLKLYNTIIKSSKARPWGKVPRLVLGVRLGLVLGARLGLVFGVVWSGFYLGVWLGLD